MEAKQLRIGNLINANGVYEGEVKTFKRFNEDLSVVFFSDGSKHGIGEYLEDIKPIPLTEEWLLKFGYWKLDHKDAHFVIKGHTIWKCNNLLMCEKNGIIIKSVHQLQNLYFALTNNELIIK